jgi:DNA-binding NarL/FixJ family response regulator
MEVSRVLIADDQQPFREGLLALFQSVSDIEVVGEATTGAEAVALAEALQPDVVLMDFKMPGMNGIEATNKILTASPHIGIIVLTMFDDDDTVFAALRAGARGYVLKGALKAEILRAIRAVTSGEAIFGPAIARRLIQHFAELRATLPQQAFPELTTREREVLTLIAQHQTNPAIAERLSLSPKTVRNIASSIFIRAREAGLG